MADLKLTSINEARSIKRSLSNPQRFAPIKLKSLKQARLERKASNSGLLTQHEDVGTLVQSLPNEFQAEVLKNPEILRTGASPVQAVQRKIVSNPRYLTKKSAIIKIQKSSNEVRKKSMIEYGQKRTPSASGTEAKRQLSCINKGEKSSLDFWEDASKAKKLTRDQEKGLISRLQGCNLVKVLK